MIDAVGNPQTLLLLGGTSDIALAVAEQYASVRPLRVVLAARGSERLDAAATRLRALGCEVDTVAFEACDQSSYEKVVDESFAGGDVDVAVLAFGLLGDPEEAWTDVSAAVTLAQVNYLAPVGLGVALSTRFRQQGHGTLVALSSVAGERPRRSNFVYGSTKAGFDAFFTGLTEALRPEGVSVLVVRPGFVRSKMTDGLEPAPLSVTPEQVATAIVQAVRSGKESIWVPKAMRPVMSTLRHLPKPVFRRLPV